VAEFLGGADPLDVLVEQFAYLVAALRNQQATDAEIARLWRVRQILLDPFVSDPYHPPRTLHPKLKRVA